MFVLPSQMEFFFFGFGPAIVTSTAAFFFYAGLRDLRKTSWVKIAIGIGLLIGVGIPIVLFISLEVGFPYSPDSIIRKNGKAIAQALTEYHTDKGNYPETLNELVPAYLTDLREPKTIWGWLYTANENSFTLGYVFYIDKFGYTICKYSTTASEWDCPLDYSTAPFHLAPTPMP